jgi:hypothetical protein
MNKRSFITINMPNKELVNALYTMLTTNVPAKFKNLFKAEKRSDNALSLILTDVEKDPIFTGSFISFVSLLIKKSIKAKEHVKIYFKGAHAAIVAAYMSPTGPWDFYFEQERDTKEFKKFILAIKSIPLHLLDPNNARGHHA